MAKIVIEIEDALGGELSLCSAGDDLRTAATASTYMTAQNTATYLAQQLRAVDMKRRIWSGQ